MSESLVRVINLKLSDKLQKYGYNVLSITGGQVLSQPMSHWYKLSIDDVKTRVDSENKAIFNAEEINQIMPVEKVENTIINTKDVLKSFISKRTTIDENISFKDKLMSGSSKNEPVDEDGE
jgi:hypothetical protein